ncbi:type II toxin-antitoxin system HipA family toxin, partial [Roseateles sp. GG27B]
AMLSVTPELIAATQEHEGFLEIGKRMLHAWNDGMNSLRLQKTWNLPSLDEAIATAKFSDPKPMNPTQQEK